MANRIAKTEHIEWAMRDLGFPTLDGVSDSDRRLIMWAACAREDREIGAATVASDKGCGCPVNSDCIHDSILVQ